MSDFRSMFDGNKGTALFWIVVVIAAYFIMSSLPAIIGLILKLIIMVGLIYLVMKLFGKDPMDLLRKK